MGSLFDGIAGFPLASVRCGIEPIWASDIEPYFLVAQIYSLRNTSAIASVFPA